jgi:glycosyltransferase involved in cell wall biosynthesis
LDLGKIRYYDYLFKRPGPFYLAKDGLKAIMLRLGAMSRIDRKKYLGFKDCLLREGNEIISDSSYSKYSISYFFPDIPPEKVKVLYPPAKHEVGPSEVSDSGLARLINEGRKYVLLLGCNRPDKNVDIALKAIPRLLAADESLHFLLVGKVRHQTNERVANSDFLSGSDLDIAYKNAYAFIYPSLSEGFGYPPLEAMKHGTPVIASNASSIPEVLADGAAYFSPFYENDLFKAYMEIGEDHEGWSRRAKERQEAVASRQAADLDLLVNSILFPGK